MKPIYIIFILILVELLFYLYLNNDKDMIVISDYEISNNISMQIKEGTLTKTGATVIIINDNNNENYKYSKWFRIDKLENDTWKMLKPIDKNHISDELASNDTQLGNLEYNVDWSELYGKLKKGKYRLVKRIYEDEYKYFIVEFSIE